jgi:leucyl aminopeptidase
MIALSSKLATLRNTKADLLTVFVFEDPSIFIKQTAALKPLVNNLPRALTLGAFQGKEKETVLLYPEKTRSSHLLMVGLGKREKFSLEGLRRGAAAGATAALSLKARSLALFEPDPDLLSGSSITVPAWDEIGMALGEGALLASYKFNKYMTDKTPAPKLRTVLVVSESKKREEQIRRGVKLAETACAGTWLARDLANAPGNEIYPETLAQRAVETGKNSGFRVNVLNEKTIRSLGMGGLLGVSQGSSRPPRFIIMEHNAKRKDLPTIVLVGKGVTFDSGGISIKPAQDMAEMKMDMSGAAAVIGTMQGVAKLKLPLHVVGLVPTTENLLGGSAMKPGDILTHYNGKTSEVDNTDAEGRLILADALSYASRYRPDLVIDLATLTGACVVALGSVASGMMGNNQEAMDRLQESGNRTYERVWQLPLFEEYEKLIRSDVADVKNIGGRWAGAITAALFLKKFIGNYRWIHLDIAGPAIMEEATEYIPKGGSGVGVRLLLDFLRHWKEN